jgi:ferrous iron transport protein B
MDAPTAAARERTIAVVGNPNVGKSTLFNELTGLRQRVANYPGVTVDAREGFLPEVPGQGELRLLDLPGTYSLRPKAADEAVVERVLLGEGGAPRPDVVLVVLDATNLRRNLYLLTEVVDLGQPMAVALNMVDEARRGGQDVPTDELREALGVPVVETVASQGQGLDDLRKALDEARPAERKWAFEGELEARLAASPGETPWTRLKALASADAPADLRSQEVGARYAWITEVLHGSTSSAGLRARSDRIDRVLLHPLLGPAFFLFVMALVFQSVFTWAGPLMDLIDAGFGAVSGFLAANLPGLVGEGVTSLIVDGALAGVGSVVIFLPQIVILFLLLGLLEDTGYMARAAFIVDRPLRLVGLSGRSFIPLLSSFACAIPGVMATRTIPNKFERMLAIFVAPLMTCSARLPVYTLLIAAFVPSTTVAGVFNLQGLVLLGLYLSGIAAGALVALIVSRARHKRRGRELPLVVELPPYRRPSAKCVAMKLGIRAGDFLKRAGTVIFAVSIVLWVLMTFPKAPEDPTRTAQEQAAVQLEGSFAGKLGQAIEPVIAPLGYDWKMGVGLIASFAAREVFVSTLGIVYSLGDEVDEESADLKQVMAAERRPDGSKTFSLATVFSLLAFYVFALQCGATVAVVKRETSSWKFAAGQLVAYLALAYLSALVVYQAMSAAGY